MSFHANFLARVGSVFVLALPLVALNLAGQTPVVIQTNAPVRVMAANLTSGTGQSYEAAGIRIFQGLKPDIVAMQEFRYNSSTADAQLRQLVDTAFGTDFFYYREINNPSYNIPNGIVSRWPILSSGTWEDVDTGVNDRGFAWARIDLPGTNDLYVVSIHLKASSGSDNASRRAAEATNLVNLIHANFPANAWIVVAGDCNIYDPSEAAYQHLAGSFSDSPIPTDAETGGDADTNAGRAERYDYVFPSQNLSSQLTPTTFASHSFPKGLVFDSAVYSPLSDVSPVQSGDSQVTGMQHMGVMRTLNVTYYVTNYVSNPPSITLQPQSQTVAQGSHVAFTVTADGTPPLAYQWRFASTNITGATTSSYTRTNAQPADAGGYCVVVTNSAGNLTSSTAALTVLVPPAIITQPSAQAVCQGANASFTVTATGTEELIYQWRFNSADLPGATSSVYTRHNVQPAHMGSYSVIVTNSAGYTASSTAELTLVVPPPFLTTPSPGLILWQGLSNLSYTVQAKASLDETNWVTLGTASSPGESISFTNQADAPRRFYRVTYP
jgi:endonuclease/exonuclease/phosphatase family metal-dependent hydrolase